MERDARDLAALFAEDAEFVNVVGANPVRVGAPEVYGGLQTRMLDTVPVSALAAVAMQWYTRLNYVAKDNFAIIVGGSLIKQEKFDELSEAEIRALLERARSAESDQTCPHARPTRVRFTLADLERAFHRR